MCCVWDKFLSNLILFIIVMKQQKLIEVPDEDVKPKKPKPAQSFKITTNGIGECPSLAYLKKQPSTIIAYFSSRLLVKNISFFLDKIQYRSSLKNKYNDIIPLSYDGCWDICPTSLTQIFSHPCVTKEYDNSVICIVNEKILDNKILTARFNDKTFVELSKYKVSKGDMSALYGRAWFECLTYRTDSSPTEIDQAIHMSFELINYNSREFNNTLHRVLEEDYIVYWDHEIPPEYLNVLMFLAKGVNTDVGPKWAPIKMAYITTIRKPNTKTIDSEMILEFIKILVESRQEYSSCVYGFYKACQILFMRRYKDHVVRCDGSTSPKFTWTRPLPGNPIWWLSDDYKKNSHEAINMSECTSLLSIPLYQLGVMATHLANAISFGCGATLNYFNITGQVLSQITTDNHQAREFFAKKHFLFDNHRFEPIQNFYVYACHQLELCTEFKLDVRAFIGVKFMESFDEKHLEIWSNKIVYVQHPFSYAYMFSKWPFVYGLMKDLVRMDFDLSENTKENKIMMNCPEENRKNFIFNPNPILIMNSILQKFYSYSFKMEFFSFPDGSVDELANCIIPGTVVTYDLIKKTKVDFFIREGIIPNDFWNSTSEYLKMVGLEIVKDSEYA